MHRRPNVKLHDTWNKSASWSDLDEELVPLVGRPLDVDDRLRCEKVVGHVEHLACAARVSTVRGREEGYIYMGGAGRG